MGCDIHMYVEYTNKKDYEEIIKNGKKPYWMSFGGRINPGRNYVLFGVLAGVRYDFPNANYPRGLPDDLGYHSLNDSRIYISEEKLDGEYSVTLDEAKRYCGFSPRIRIHNNSYGEPKWVDNPDWHSHSWMTTKEFSTALRRYSKYKDNWGTAIEYKALLSAMKTLEKSGNYQARVVFWFDN